MADTAQDRQIVVATDHLRLVLAELGDRNVTETAVEPRLGLTLVTVEDVTGSERALADDARAARAAAGDAESAWTPLDTVLAGIRARAGNRWSGWAPTMGKNRTLTGVQFKPYSSGGSVDRPTRADAGRALPPVAAPPGARRVRVGLFDTRLAPHAALTGRYVADDDALLAPVARGGQRLWWEGHSTFIAGVIRRQAPTAVLDVRTALRPGVVPAGGSTADQEWTMPLWDFAARLVDYQDAGVEVINLSVGVSTEDGRPPLVLDRAIARLTATTVIVAAAGNHGSRHVTDEQRRDAGLPKPGAPLFPAALDNVLAVGALHGAVAAEFNPRGADGTGTAPWIDVFAPGVETISTYLGDGAGEKVLVRDIAGREELVEFGGWASWSGTSFAAGEITGAVAALLAQGYDPIEAVAEVRRHHPRPSGG